MRNIITKVFGAFYVVFVGSVSAFTSASISRTSQLASSERYPSTRNSNHYFALPVAGNYFAENNDDFGTAEEQLSEKVISPAYGLAIGSFAVAFLVALLSPGKFFHCCTSSFVDFRYEGTFPYKSYTKSTSRSKQSCTMTYFGGLCPPSEVATIVATHITVFAALCAVQAYRLRFIFDKDGFFTIKKLAESPIIGQEWNSASLELEDSGENYVVGGPNNWKLDKFVNYEFYPSVDFPVLVYFKETDTPKVKQF